MSIEDRVLIDKDVWEFADDPDLRAVAVATDAVKIALSPEDCELLPEADRREDAVAVLANDAVTNLLPVGAAELTGKVDPEFSAVRDADHTALLDASADLEFVVEANEEADARDAVALDECVVERDALDEIVLSADADCDEVIASENVGTGEPDAVADTDEDTEVSALADLSGDIVESLDPIADPDDVAVWRAETDCGWVAKFDELPATLAVKEALSVASEEAEASRTVADEHAVGDEEASVVADAHIEAPALSLIPRDFDAPRASEGEDDALSVRVVRALVDAL